MYMILVMLPLHYYYFLKLFNRSIQVEHFLLLFKVYFCLLFLYSLAVEAKWRTSKCEQIGDPLPLILHGNYNMGKVLIYINLFCICHVAMACLYVHHIVHCTNIKPYIEIVPYRVNYSLLQGLGNSCT